MFLLQEDVMRIGESSAPHNRIPNIPLQRDTIEAPSQSCDEVSISKGRGEEQPPQYLSRELLAEIQKKGIDGAGPLTPEQKEYLEQLFTSSAVIDKPQSIFGIGGVLFPDSAGKIQHIALQFGNVEFDRPLPEKTEKALLGVYKTLFTNMSDDTRFTIATANDRGEEMLRQAVKESGMENPERVNIVNAHAKKGFSIWIRDSMIPVENADRTSKLLIQDRTYWPGPEDNKIPYLIAENNDGISSQSHPTLRIDGGNVLSNSKTIIVGKDSVDHTTKLLQERAIDPEWKKDIIKFYEARTGNEIVGEGAASAAPAATASLTKPNQETIDDMWKNIAPLVFESEFQRKVFVICKDDPATPNVEEQPVFHIDMAVTPVGDQKFLVGDPGMAIDIFKSLSPAERRQTNREMAAAAGFPEDTDLIGKLMEVNGGKEHQANFDNVARELKDRGYEIERLPCMIGLRTTWSLPYLTYNNCIQENYTDENGKHVQKVYLPVYGCEPLEKLAVSTYERLGYEVVPLQMAAVSILEGAIRCSSYPVAKTDVPKPSA